MAPTARTTLRLAKEDFKFAAAHFTLFPDGSGELLHGHNFRVSVELEGGDPDDSGLLVELALVKRHIRAVCERLDERTLIPEKSPQLALRRDGDAVEVAFGERRYRLPAADVAMLPLTNVTIELLARLVWDELAPALGGTRVEVLRVSVEETAGQSCSYAAPLR